MTSGLPIPRLTVRGFEVNPSPHEIAIGSLEQWRRSKLSKAWKNVLVSLVKGGPGGGSLCVWRDAIRNDGSNGMELLERVAVKEIQRVGEDNGILRVAVYHSPEEPLTFRCMDEPSAIGNWTTAIRTVLQIAHNPAPRQAPAQQQPAPEAKKIEVNLMSFDQAPAATTNNSNQSQDLLGGMNQHQHPPQAANRPVHYQTYPNATNNNFPTRNPNYPQQQPNYTAYSQQQHQRPMHQHAQQHQRQNNNSYPFSQPPPLPFSTQRKSGFPVQQSTSSPSFNTAYNYNNPLHRSRSPTSPTHPQQQPMHTARSISPAPGAHQQQYNRQQQQPSPAMPRQHPMQHARSMSPVPGAHHQQPYNQQQQQHQQRTPAKNVPLANQFPQPTPPRPKPTPTRASPHRSKSVPNSPSNQKKVQNVPMSQEDLKRYIITTWALDPPENRLLKPLIELVRTIDKVFPPNLKKVPPHEYFGRWKPVTPGEYNQPGGLDKILRRLRFFLHPDKLPQDFTPDQSFLCKLLWDIINDAQQQQQKSL